MFELSSEVNHYVLCAIVWNQTDCRLFHNVSRFPPSWTPFCTVIVMSEMAASVSANLHYTDTGYGHVVQHHQQTSSQQFYNLLYNKFATSQCQSPKSRHVKMLGCGKFLSVSGEFVVQEVVELLWACPLVVLYLSVAGVRVVEFDTYC